MNQIFVKSGRILVEDVPMPSISDNTILVDVKYSCISAGTELSVVKSSSESLVKKAITQPNNITKFVHKTLDEGLQGTINKVKNRLEQETPLGYSASGIIKYVGKEVRGFKVGDRVACAGSNIANHADFIEVPTSLAVKAPDNLSLEAASTVTLGCIALQGVRRADAKIGENVVVIGLGILGQISVQLLRAAGCNVIGIDLDDRRIKLAMENENVKGINSNLCDCVNEVLCLTNGYGADSVIITAATNLSLPLSQAFRMCRKKGRVVLVGTVGIEINREDIYEKELDFYISTSYGPGRYDESYEKNCIDYPYGYVRWTENRNMQAYLDLLANKSVNLENIIEAVYDISNAEDAFHALTSEKKPLIVLLKYKDEENKNMSKKQCNEIKPLRQIGGRIINVAIVGPGSFAKTFHLPNLKRMNEKFNIHAIMSKTPFNAKKTAAQYGAKYSTTDFNEILDDEEVDLVMICTRHNLHASMAIEAMRKGKAVFLEKPMALNQQELDDILQTIKETNMPFMVGFNRRFSKYAAEAKEHVKNRKNPMIINYQMNAGYIPLDNWVHTYEGGGRIIGEACHIFDLFNYFTDSQVDSISVDSISPMYQNISARDNVITTIKYKDGSVCSLTYTSLGNNKYPKESFQIFCDNKLIAVEDYKKITGYGIKVKDIRSKTPDKGHFEELEAFYNAVINKDGYAIQIKDLQQTALISFAVDDELTN